MADRDFYVTGESYAGHYVPAVSNRIFLENNKPDTKNKINLKGFAIGNGLTDPGIQYGGYSDYALRNGLISAGTGRVVKAVRTFDCGVLCHCVPAHCWYAFRNGLISPAQVES